LASSSVASALLGGPGGSVACEGITPVGLGRSPRAHPGLTPSSPGSREVRAARLTRQNGRGNGTQVFLPLPQITSKSGHLSALGDIRTHRPHPPPRASSPMLTYPHPPSPTAIRPPNRLPVLRGSLVPFLLSEGF
jgi:hypothetical protein